VPNPAGAKRRGCRKARLITAPNGATANDAIDRANISEGFGRGTPGERNRALRIARSEAEETIRHLRANLELKRIRTTVFWRLSNRLITIVKMLTSLLNC